MSAITPIIGVAQTQKGAVERPALLKAGQAGEIDGARADGAGAEPNGAPAPIVNPALRFDLRLGLVVVEFFNDRGEVSNSIPSPRQLKAYENELMARTGTVPGSVDGAPSPQQAGLAVLA